ncbi:MAG: hypothetical protein H0V14_05725 [Chitinophagaceae bacterium]|jgi:hypothetical protein|nr:hypothetical protein [Chitinophagaceae bacterium]
MAINLVEEIQQNLGWPALQKIDPNTQEVKKPENVSAADYLGQAAIPAVLLGLYKFSGNKEGNAAIVNGSLSDNLLNRILGNTKDEVVQKVAEYTGNTTDYTAGRMELIAREAIKVINENISTHTSDEAVRTFLIDQRNNILVYIPAGLQIGKVLHDNTIDDRTNKMEGPVSSNMHWLEKLFPSTDRKKEENF